MNQVTEHLPVIFQLSTRPFLIEKQQTYEIHKADCDIFESKLDTKININNLDGSNAEQLESATLNWIKTVKNAKDTAIPKSSYQYKYQLKITPDLRDLETQFTRLKQYVSCYE